MFSPLHFPTRSQQLPTEEEEEAGPEMERARPARFGASGGLEGVAIFGVGRETS